MIRGIRKEAVIELDGRFAPQALAGLTGFSAIEVVFHFDQVADAEINAGARHPGGRSDWLLVGILARATARRAPIA
jgi:tRNA (Thr-GGU) A37 N-methylase